MAKLFGKLFEMLFGQALRSFLGKLFGDALRGRFLEDLFGEAIWSSLLEKLSGEPRSFSEKFS